MRTNAERLFRKRLVLKSVDVQQNKSSKNAPIINMIDFILCAIDKINIVADEECRPPRPPADAEK